MNETKVSPGNWGPGAPKVPLRSDEARRNAKRAKQTEKRLRQGKRLEQSHRRNRPA